MSTVPNFFVGLFFPMAAFQFRVFFRVRVLGSVSLWLGIAGLKTLNPINP